MIRMAPIRVGEDEDVALRVGLGIGIHLAVALIYILKVEQPVVEDVLVPSGTKRCAFNMKSGSNPTTASAR